MAIRTFCPHCQLPQRASNDEIGRTVLCTGCGGEWVVPSKKVPPGSEYGDYTVLRPIGVGGNSEVHLAEHVETGHQVALKIFFIDEVDSKDCMRFEKEIKHITAITHPGIIEAYEGKFLDDMYYLAMEYVDGETLDEFLESNGPMDEYEAMRIAANIAEVMEYLWEKHHIIHRDLKPGNVMLSYAGEVKLMDFGIAKSMYDARLTGARTIIGTPYYMSPEQCTPSRPVDLRSDIYGLGATFYHMVTGEFPFDGDEPLEIVRRQIFDRVPSPKSYNPALSDHCVNLIEKMLQKSPAKRHQSWSEVLVELRASLA